MRNLKYFVHPPNHFCANSTKIYEYKHIYQSFLREFLNNHSLLPFFSIACFPQLDSVLYNRLKQWVAREDDYLYDNLEDAHDDLGIKRPVSQIYLPMQE